MKEIVLKKDVIQLLFHEANEVRADEELNQETKDLILGYFSIVINKIRFSL
ncbi:MAG: hypothetical protein ACI4C7_05915 [Clostridia bacterium]